MKFTTFIIIILISLIAAQAKNLGDPSTPSWDGYGKVIMDYEKCKIDKVYKNYCFDIKETDNEETYKVGEKLGDDNPTVKAFLFVNLKFGDTSLADFDFNKAVTVSTKIQNAYLEEAPYHNRKHPADMLMRLYFWFKKITEIKDENQTNKKYEFYANMKAAHERLDNLIKNNKKSLLELIIAVTGHDAGHPGIANAGVCTKAITDELNLSRKILDKVCKVNEAIVEGKRNLEAYHSYITNKILIENFPTILGDKLESTKSKIKEIRNRDMIGLDEKDFVNNIDKYIMATNFDTGKTIKSKLIDEKLFTKIEDSDFLAFFIMALDIANPTSPNLDESLKLSQPVICEFITEHAFTKINEADKAAVESKKKDIKVVEEVRKIKDNSQAEIDENLANLIAERAKAKQEGFYTKVLPEFNKNFLITFQKSIGVRDSAYTSEKEKGNYKELEKLVGDKEKRKAYIKSLFACLAKRTTPASAGGTAPTAQKKKKTKKLK